MFLTVGIPVFNGAKYIRESIQSVLSQTYTDFELIITDDGSTDESLDIIRSFDDSRMKIVSDGAHKGLAVRLNEQIAMARGDYFVRMDADDVMLPQRLARQVEFVSLHPETDVVGSSAIIIDEGGRRIGYRSACKWDKKTLASYLNYSQTNSFMHPTVMGRTDWFRKYYYNPACEGCEDMDLWARSQKESSFYELQEPLLLYRDPQQLNLDVYLFRRRQERYVLRINKEKFSFFSFHSRKITSQLKSLSAYLLTKIGKQSWMLKMRNTQISPLHNRVLHVITSLRTGGAEKLMVELLPRLQKERDVELLLFDGVRTPFYDQLEARGVRIYKFGENCNVYNPFLIVRLLPFLRKFDFVHTHNTACQMFVAMANIFVGTHAVTTEHSTSNRRRGHKFFWYLDRWMYRQYDTIVTVSDVAGNNIKEYVKDQSLPIKTISNGIDVMRYGNASPCPEIVKGYPDVFRAIMVAGFRYEKDQTTVINAFKHLPANYHLFFVGDGEEKKDKEDYVDSLNLSERIHFLGIRMDVPNLLQSADVVIMSSHREGLSLSNLEGMASGKPFIASDVDGLREIVSGYGILFPHEDAEALAAAIRKCCEDKQYAAEIGKKCQEKAMQYDIALMAEKYSNLYNLCSTK